MVCFICTVDINDRKMETKKPTKKAIAPQKETSTHKKRVSKTMQAAMKFQGAFDREEVIKFANS